MFMAKSVVMVSRIYTYLQSDQVAYIVIRTPFFMSFIPQLNGFKKIRKNYCYSNVVKS